jgi:hypothetical protein
MDRTDQNILSIPSCYESLTPLQLWFELGEDGLVPEGVTQEEIVGRLESLRGVGVLELVEPGQHGTDSSPLGYRVRSRPKVR